MRRPITLRRPSYYPADPGRNKRPEWCPTLQSSHLLARCPACPRTRLSICRKNPGSMFCLAPAWTPGDENRAAAVRSDNDCSHNEFSCPTTSTEVCRVKPEGVSTIARAGSFDHLASARMRIDGGTERPSALAVLSLMINPRCVRDLGGLPDRQVGGSLAFENQTSVDAGRTINV
jgi:hypothetical protein